MRSTLELWGALVSCLFIAVAIGDRADPRVALVAVTFGGATAALVLLRIAYPPTGLRPRADPAGSGRPAAFENPIREWFGGGELGREEIVRLIDRIDRMGAHPNLATRPEAEMEKCRRMPYREFLEYVARRLDEVEASG